MVVEKKAAGKVGEYKMDIEKISKNEEKITFLVKKSEPAFINAIRRIAMEEVPVLAIDEVSFVKNDSALYDEVIAHRLGLIPLTTDLKSLELPNECSCKGKGCAKCQIKFKLKGEGPNTVYASQLKFNDKDVKSVYPKIPIVLLLKKQELEIEGIAVLGKGKEHMKWSPGLIYYSYQPSIIVNNNSKKFDEFKNKYPKEIFDSKGKISKDLILQNDLIDACDGVCDDIVKVEYDNTSFIFNVESWGQLDAKEIILKSAEILENKSKNFTEQLK